MTFKRVEDYFLSRYGFSSGGGEMWWTTCRTCFATCFYEHEVMIRHIEWHESVGDTTYIKAE